MADDAESWYRSALSVDDERQQLIRNNVQQAVNVNPDQDAKHQALARFAQIPTDAVRAYPKPVEQQVAAQRINAQALTRDNPSLSRFLSVQDNANIVHDDIPHTAAIEQLHRQMPQPDESKSIGDSLANAPYALLQGLGGSFNKLFTVTSLAASAPAVIFDKLAGTHSADWMFKNIVEPNVQNEQAFQLDKNAGLPEKALHTGGSLLGTLSQIMLPGIGGTAAELDAMATAGAAVKQALEHGAKSMALPAATDAIDVGRKVYQETGDGKAALRAANAQYVATTGMGIMPMSVAGNIPVRVASGAASGAVMGEASRQFTNANLPDQMKQPFSWEDTFLSSVAGGVLGIGGPAKPNSVGDLVRQTYVDAGRADKAQDDYSKLSVLGQMSAESKLRERSPEAFRQFIQDVSDDGALKEVYISGRKLAEVLNQSKVDPETLQERLPDVAKQLGEAVQTDGDVRIPIADYATHIAGGPLDDKLLQEMKTSPDGMTYADAQEFQKNQTKLLADTAKKIEENTKADDEQKIQTETIQSNIEAQLKDTKRFQPEVNKAYASLQTAYITTRAEQLGMKPGEFYDKYGSSISAEKLIGFEQSAYHGSPYNFDKFSLEHLGRGEGAQVYGWGLYFAGNKDVAEHYRQTLAIGRQGYPEIEINGKSAADIELPSGWQLSGAMFPEAIEAPRQTLRGKTAKLFLLNRLNDEIKNSKAFLDTPYRKSYEMRVERALESKRFIENISDKSFTVNGKDAKGQLYETKIPEDNELLDLDKTLDQQPSIPAKAIQNIKHQLEKSGMLDEYEEHLGGFNEWTGNDLVKKVLPRGLTEDEISDIQDFPDAEQALIDGKTDKAVSLYLQNLGVKGSKYLDGNSRKKGEGASNYVIFDDSTVEILTKYFQKSDEEAIRGSFDPKRLAISLGKDADLSTFLHETGHYFLEVDSRLASMPDAPEGLKNDFQTTLDWLNVHDEKTWNGMTLEQQRDYHEKFAKGFESYLFEGKAPTVEMQGVFSRFRSWLLNVYKKLVNIGSPVNDEMRGVFDRMLASENAIKQAEQIRSMKRMFETKPEGMTDQQYTDYLKTNDQATNQAISELDKKSLANMKWLSNAKSKALRDLQRQADGERDKIREEVTKEIEARPEYQAETFLRKGEITKDGEEIKALAGHKLDTDRVKELIPQSELSAEDLKSLGYGKGGMLQKGGLDPDLVADMIGFPNGETLVRNLMGLEKRGDVISRMTDERMLERHGELVDPVSMDRAAEAAIHNDVRAKFLATELRNLSKATGPVGMLRKAAREAAEATIAGKRVGDIRPLQYLAAEAKTGREAEKFFKKADIQNAAEQKRAQLLNNQLYQAAKNALEDVRKGVDYLQKFDKEQKGIEIEYREQIDNLLDRFDLRKSVSNADLAKRQSLLDFANEQQAKGYEPNIPDYLLDEANKQHYKNLSVEQFRGLVDSVKSIEQLGKLKQKILDKNDLRDFKEVVGEAVSAMSELRQRTPESNRGLTKIDAKWLKAKQLARGADSSLLKMEQMLDWLDSHDSNGVFNRVIMRRMAEAEGKENDLRKELTAKIKDLYTKDVQKDFNKVLVIPELTDSKTGQPQRLIKRELLAMALNSGNESNFQKMLKGEAWTQEGVMAALNKHLTKADIDFVNGAWKAVGSLWPQKEALERRLGNSAPDKIEARPLNLTNGKLEGGYYPEIYDGTRSYDVDQRQQRLRGELGVVAPVGQRITTSHDYTYARSENYARPILLSLDALPRHLNQVVHDLSYREAVMDADRFFADPNVREGIEKALGPEYYQQMRPWLQAIANDRVYDSKGLAFWDKAAHWARTNATMVGLGYRVSTMLIHGSSAASNSVGEIGLRWFTGGIRDVLGTPQKMSEARDFIFERSDEVRHRINSFDRDISDAMKEMEQRSVEGPQGTAQRTLDNAKRFAYYGVAMLDFASVMPTWKGAYNKALAPEAKGGLGLEEKDAIYFADKSVRNAHGGTGTKDLSAMQRGGEVQKLFTMFYSFWNHFYNRQRDIGRNAMSAIENAKSGNYEDARSDFAMVLARSWFYFVVPQILHGALKTPTGNEDNQEQSWAAWASEEIGLGLFSGIPVVRDIANSAFTGRDYTATPAAQLVTALGKTGKDVENLVKGEEVSDKWLKHAVQTSGYVLGLPTGQVSNTTQFLWDVAEGRQNPEDLKDWWKGLTYGQY